MKAVKCVFAGLVFYRYPDSPAKTLRLYFRTGPHRGTKSLHRLKWELAHGPIPANHHIHHIDHDPLNNSLSNLALRERREHGREHGLENGKVEWWKRRPATARACRECGQTFSAKMGSRICSVRCKSAINNRRTKAKLLELRKA